MFQILQLPCIPLLVQRHFTLTGMVADSVRERRKCPHTTTAITTTSTTHMLQVGFKQTKAVEGSLVHRMYTGEEHVHFYGNRCTHVLYKLSLAIRTYDYYSHCLQCETRRRCVYNTVHNYFLYHAKKNKQCLFREFPHRLAGNQYDSLIRPVSRNITKLWAYLSKIYFLKSDYYVGN